MYIGHQPEEMLHRSVSVTTIFAGTPFMVTADGVRIDTDTLNRHLVHGKFSSLTMTSIAGGGDGGMFDKVYVIRTSEYILVRTVGNRCVAMHLLTHEMTNFPMHLTGNDREVARKFLRRIVDRMNPTPARVVPPQYTPPVAAPPPPRQDYGQPFPTPPAAPYRAPQWYDGDRNPYGGGYQPQPNHGGGGGGYQPYQGAVGGYQPNQDAAGGYQPQPHQGVAAPYQGAVAGVQPTLTHALDNSLTAYTPKLNRSGNRVVCCAVSIAIAVLVGLVLLMCFYIIGIFVSTSTLMVKNEKLDKMVGEHVQRFQKIEAHYNEDSTFVSNTLSAQGTTMVSVKERLIEMRTDFEDHKRDDELKFAKVDRQQARYNERIGDIESYLLQSGKKSAPPLEIGSPSSNDRVYANEISTVVKPPSLFGMERIFTNAGYVIVSLITLVWAVNLANVCLNGRN